jgi:acetoin:2,6-dichlorophenolindophenol oxidoreductase subunit alpha
MVDEGTATEADFEDVWAALRADIEEAIAFADASPLPTPDQLLNDVYTVAVG